MVREAAVRAEHDNKHSVCVCYSLLLNANK